MVPPHRTGSRVHDHERYRHRIHTRTRGHAELHDDWGGKSYYYLTDATGNVLGLADSTGKRTHTYAYGPTGLPRTTPTEAVPQPYRYAGAYADPTGLYKMGHRYYAPTLGRFTQPDSSGQEKNAYLYAGGDPINNTDPSGLSLMSFASSAMKKVGVASDILAVGQFASQVSSGQYKEAAGTALSFAADKAFTAGCTYFTGGAGAAPCAVGGMAVGEGVNRL
ncbi:RHS repeat-associated core domain-containing protein [Streptomyces sp. NA03103]|uniref:RHS repeat-associated core domain-containing protein n=1 Tax=Streptomyces sp. NA03103 TaxID=2742134 RepID=UPI0020CAE99D|nr:RHS repeat-associated core domain-containing protein [Streptomyces sp. NA03103]